MLQEKIPPPTPSPRSSPVTDSPPILPRSLSEDDLSLLCKFEQISCPSTAKLSPKCTATFSNLSSQSLQLKLPLKREPKTEGFRDTISISSLDANKISDDSTEILEPSKNQLCIDDEGEFDQQLNTQDEIDEDQDSSEVHSPNSFQPWRPFVTGVYFSTLSLIPPRPSSNSPSNVILVYVALFAAQIFWSGFHVAGKYAFTYISPEVLPTFRAIGAIPIFYALGVYEHGWDFHILSWTDHKWMMVMGLIGSTIPQQLFNLGLLLADASIGGMIQPIIPICTTIAAIALRREIFSWGKAGGVSLAIAGSVIMILAESETNTSVNGSGAIGDDGNSDTGDLVILGTILFVLQCVITSAYIIGQKPLFARISVNSFTFWLFVYGGIGHFFIGVFFLPSQNWSDLPLTIIPIILYTVIFASVAAFSCFVYATKHLPASISSLGICVQSVASPILGAIFLGESVSLLQGFGGLLIVGGIVWVVWAKAHERVILPLLSLQDISVMKDSNVIDNEGQPMQDSTVLSDDEGDSDSDRSENSDSEEDTEAFV